MKRTPALCLLATCLLLPATAFSQWQWRDSNGRMVYSDVPPPPGVPDGSILKAPGRFAGSLQPLDTGAPAAAAAAAPAPARPPAKPGAALASEEEAFQKRRTAHMKQETELARKEAQEAERQTRCSQLRNYANGLQQGIRVATVAPDGSLNRLDGDQRQAELERTNASIERNCI